MWCKCAALTGLMMMSFAMYAKSLPVRIFYNDQAQVKISLDEPSTGCVMSGVLVHPVERPEAKVVWFSERICGKKISPVSYISNELNAPDNIIHKGDNINVTPAEVTILEAKTI